METVYIYALAANLSFAVGVQFFTHYARRVSSLWVNCFKGAVAAALFALTLLAQGGFHAISPGAAALFLASGMMGLGLADIFLIKAFSLMGPGRTMMLFGFQPLIIGAVSYFAFGQALEAGKVYAVLFFIVCLFIFSLESFKKQGHWNARASLYALGGVALDGLGVLVTRYAFNNSPGLNTVEGNFYRALGALLLFAALSRVKPFHFLGKIKELGGRSLLWITLGSVAGTYLSLMFYLSAIRYSGALAAVSGIAITGTIFASAFECLAERKLPSRYLLASFAFFLAGMAFLF
ncbi:MAG: EamA family transporter [Elusimicrobiales bacterium]|nr:EamA family transporter [Elusimicrobiales bacterium]